MRHLKDDRVWTRRLAMACLLLAWLLRPAAARADVGLIWTAQGGDITPGEDPTQVQMVSEAVTLTLAALETAPGQPPRADEALVAHVDAVFQMRNQGEEAEALEVWFPLTTGAGYGTAGAATYPSQAEHFQAWVDGEPVAVMEAPGRDLLGFRDAVPWTTWPVTFPVRRDVALRVAYDVHPVDWGGWAVAHYILETGADWYGPIGEGTVTFRLPYVVTPMNVPLAEMQEAYSGPGRPFEITVDGTDVTWHFTDLEPRPFPAGEERATDPFPETDNLILPMMLPATWNEIEDARTGAETHPQSVEAQLRLAAALEAGTQRVKVFAATTPNALLIEETAAAYQRALELAPQDVDVRVAYLAWLAIPRYDADGTLALGKGVDALLSETQELAPEDRRVSRVARSVREGQDYVALRTSDAPARTLVPSPTATLRPPSTHVPRPTPTPTMQPTETPTATTPADRTTTSTPGSPPETETAPATPAPVSIPGGAVIAIGVAALVLGAVVWLARREAG